MRFFYSNLRFFIVIYIYKEKKEPKNKLNGNKNKKYKKTDFNIYNKKNQLFLIKKNYQKNLNAMRQVKYLQFLINVAYRGYYLKQKILQS